MQLYCPIIQQLMGDCCTERDMGRCRKSNSWCIASQVSSEDEETLDEEESEG